VEVLAEAMGMGLKAMSARGAPTAPCICIRTSQNSVKAKFAFWAFCEVRIHGVLRSSLAASNAQATPKIAHLSDAPTPIEEYAATATCVVEAQDHYMPF
jgi:hypothetical protein